MVHHSVLNDLQVECILYGAYTVLFGLVVWILSRKFDIPAVKKFIFPAIIVMYALTTLNIAYDLVGEAYAIMYTISVVQKPWMITGQSVDEITFILSDPSTIQYFGGFSSVLPTVYRLGTTEESAPSYTVAHSSNQRVLQSSAELPELLEQPEQG
ncbi:hypothetical protein BT96DRAFT_1048258 [Gymnopus androsaceus JB14]|uniref:Uncharacterized protein n=1 Tax=Gymnopus androsaceus JB14 TaxID=1447944 RepID=A0A6A4I8C2_9AGAR|nr:hypothetical protein BT96DRAFT_1048258 [Gymnopus androsaceus JB14]